MSSLRQLHQPTSRTIHLDNKDYLFFGGTAYLGLLVNPEYKDLVKKGIDIYGLNNGTSRSNNVQLGIYDEAEEYIANRFSFEDAVLFSSGYLAAQATVKALACHGAILYAPNTHPSLWVDQKPDVEFDDFQEWLTNVVLSINSAKEREFVIIANAIDNLTPELYDFSILQDIHSSNQIRLILDDSHGIGVLNKNAISANISALSSCAHIELVVLASLAKGLGTDAGVVWGSKEIIDEIKRNPMYLGASPSSPASLYALIHGDSIYDRSFDSLQKNLLYLEPFVESMNGLKSIKKFPVFTSTDPHLYRFLHHNEVLISSFPYPLPTSPLLNRIVISALHTKEDLIRLVDVLQSKD